ncbi:hypothetical protein Bca52824_065161 [Brassica carinata]|uniref:Uncharacterized protein n=1 Tax=Brassica carinata TaxID=52824 RepID=A0A8X7UC51_BRACI|nr:hypothetical protein Bca52824_065161 [Brassica carinata]
MAQPPLLNHSMLSPRRRAHRRAPDDVASLNPDRIEVAGDAEERPKWVSDDNSLANDGVVDPVIHPNTIRPLDTFWKDVPKVVVLSQQHWESFDRRRINRQQKRTTKDDWPSNVP